MRILQIGEVFSHKAKLKEKDTNIFIKFHQILMSLKIEQCTPHYGSREDGRRQMFFTLKKK